MKYYNCILLFIFFSFIYPSKTSQEIQNEINQNNNTLEQLESAIEQLEKDISNKETTKQDLQSYIDKLNQRIEYREKQIAILIQQDKRISELIYKSKIKIKEKENKLDVLKKQLINRSIYLYKHGREQIISKLVITDDWNRALNRLKYLKILLKYENELNKNISIKINELNIEQKNLKKDQKKQIQILSDAQIIHKQLQKDKKNKKNKIKEINDEKKSLQKNLTLKIKEASEIEKIIKKLISDKSSAKKREKELAKKRAMQNKSTSGNFAIMKGKLDWPTNGKVISKFGIQTNKELNTKIENIGIDIETDNNEPIYPVLDGVVSIITYLRSYGNTIIISHGGGYYTVYSNVNNILVTENEYITPENIIASSSKSENPTMRGNHFLHFEIWKDETKLNPEIWLKK